MGELAAEVRAIETASGRLHRLSCEWRRQLDLSVGATAPSIEDVHERLDAVEAALGELPLPVGTVPQISG